MFCVFRNSMTINIPDYNIEKELYFKDFKDIYKVEKEKNSNIVIIHYYFKGIK